MEVILFIVASESMSKSDIDYENKVEFSTEDVLELFST